MCNKSIDANATRAYRVAHPDTTYGTCRTESSRLLANPNVAAEVKAARRAQSRRCRVKADAVLRELASVAFADIAELFDDAGMLLPTRRIPIAVRRAIQSIRVRRERTTTRTTTVRRGNATITTSVVTAVREIEYRFADKLDALNRLCDFLGLDTSIMPLDALLLSLPPDLAAQVRDALADHPAE